MLNVQPSSSCSLQRDQLLHMQGTYPNNDQSLTCDIDLTLHKQQPLEQLVFTSNAEKPFKSFDLSSLICDKSRGIYYDDTSHYAQTMKSFHFNCVLCDRDCDHPYSSFGNLKHHMHTHHGLSYWYHLPSNPKQQHLIVRLFWPHFHFLCACALSPYVYFHGLVMQQVVFGSSETVFK